MPQSAAGDWQASSVCPDGIVICLVNKRLKEAAKKRSSVEKGDKDREPEKKKEGNNDDMR